MVELEMATGGSVAGPVRGFGRRGILRLLPHWRGNHVAAGGRVAKRPAAAAELVRTPLEPHRDASPGEAVEGRTAALALRHTLDAWRAAERDLASLATGSPHRALVQADVDALRTTHRRLFLEISLPGRSGAVDAERR